MPSRPGARGNCVLAVAGPALCDSVPCCRGPVFSGKGIFDLRERLHKLFCYWRNHGGKALVRLITLKLGRKPLASSIPAAGHAPGRIEAFGDGITVSRFGACTPLRVYSAPPENIPRISIVTDSINAGSLFGGVATAIIMATLLAEERGARLRVITRTERAQPANLAHVLEIYGIRLTHEVEFAFAPFYDRRYELDVLGDELFVTTSWWTTAATMASVPHDAIVYLLQEDERMFYPHGDDHLRCSQILRSRGIRFVVNTRLLFDHLVADGLDNIKEKGVWFEPAFPKAVFHPRDRNGSGKLALMFYARPNNLRNLFYFGIDLIDEAITRGIIDLSRWDILLVGKDIPDVVFSGNYIPGKRENLKWADYVDLVGRMDLGLGLMYTPHPSYPPLDLAASGAVVVTNRFGNKQDLGNYSRNIICGDLERESMLAALEEGIRLAADTVRRSGNYRASALGPNWKDAFLEVVRRLCGTH